VQCRMLDLGLPCCSGRACRLAGYAEVPSLLPPRSLSSCGAKQRSRRISRLSQPCVIRKSIEGRYQDAVEVVALRPAAFRRTARRVALVMLYGVSIIFARRSWGWLLAAGTITAHLFLAGFWITSAWARCRLDFRRTAKASSGSWVLVLPEPGKAALRKLWPLSSELRFRYHGQHYKLLEMGARGANLLAAAVPQKSETLLILCQRRHEGLTEAEATERRRQYGSNDYRIAVPQVRQLVLSRLLRPIFLFELASVFLWGLDGYWQFTVLSLGTLLCFEVGGAMSRHKSLAQLRATASASKEVFVLRSGEWILKAAVDLVPGDIMQVQPNSEVPCDALLLDGSATVSEAAFSGESAPVAKSAVLPEARKPEARDAHHFLYAGTRVLAARAKQDAACTCAVLQTGFHCKQGLLMRRAIASQENIRDKDTLKVVLLLLGFASIAALQIAFHGKGSNGWLKISIILSFVIQPTLPLLMTYAVQRAMEVLRTKEIICAEPLRILEAASMTTCLFDKTGTLTSDKLEAAGVMLPQQFAEATGSLGRLTPLRDLSPTEPAHQILQSCHSATMENGKLLGDPLEIAALEDLGALELPDAAHRFEFDPKLRRMTVLMESNSQALVLCKGAPEALSPLMLDAPSNYDEVASFFGVLGLRVLALAWKAIDEDVELQSMTREEAEAELHFAGFIAFQNRCKAEAPEAVRMLRLAGVRCAVVTGDALDTATHAACEAGLLGPPSAEDVKFNEADPIVELRGGSWWECNLPADSHAAQPCFPLSAAEDLYQRGRILAATELELEKIGQAAWATARYATVLARMSPPGKAKLVEILRQDDRVVMVGDGGNDVGALAAADAGIAIWPTEHPLDTDFFDDWAMRTRWQRLQRENAQALQRQISRNIEEQRSWYVQEVERRRQAGQTLDWQQLVKLLRQGQRRLAEETRKAKANQGADQSDQASAVAPFTSRTLLAVPEMLRQGQCTSCSMVMQTQQLVLSTIIAMWRYAALSVEGARQSEIQMIFSNFAFSIAFAGFINAKAPRQPARVRPATSIFEPATILSTLGQALVHVWVLCRAVSWAKELMGPAAMADLLKFQEWAQAQPFDFWDAISPGALFSRPFRPNLLNSVVFYVELVQGIAILLVNYKGRPWIQGILENPPLLAAAASALALAAAGATGWSQAGIRALQLTTLPPLLQVRLSALIFLSLLGTWVLDRSLEAFLCRDRAIARWEAPVAVPDLKPWLIGTAKVAVRYLPWLLWILLVLSGDMLLWIVAWQLWRWLRARRREEITAA